MFLLFISKFSAESRNNKFNDKKSINENRNWLVRFKCDSRDNVKKSTENYIWVSRQHWKKL